jgi:hypothetical protein
MIPPSALQERAWKYNLNLALRALASLKDFAAVPRKKQVVG